MNDEPVAFFITWTVYGTFLQGDARGWHKLKKGIQAPEPRLAEWRSTRLKHEVVLLNEAQRLSVNDEIQRLSTWREWTLWACNVRSNHVHVVLTARDCAGSKVRDQLKANCTRVLRDTWNEFRNRPIWSEGGDWKCINKEDDLDQVVLYVKEAQDRKERDNIAPP